MQLLYENPPFLSRRKPASENPRHLAKWLETDLLVQTLKQQLHESLSEEAYTQTWQQGQKIDLEDVISQILRDVR